MISLMAVHEEKTGARNIMHLALFIRALSDFCGIDLIEKLLQHNFKMS